jgi:radical SAM protein with 4Fe4S-binding SPASM domain
LIYTEKGIKEEVEEKESRRLEDRSGSCFWGVVPPLSTLKLRKDLHSNFMKVVEFVATALNYMDVPELHRLAEDNVRQKPLPWIWENSRLFNFFRSLRRGDVNDLCQKCIYFAKCKGRCKAMNILDGRFSEPDSHCWLVA